MNWTATVVAVVLCTGVAPAQSKRQTFTQTTQPKSVTLCELAHDPAAYNHALIRISGTASLGFEDFTLSDPKCQPPVSGDFDVWLTYGGTLESGTIYCCPGEGEKRIRKKTVEVEGISVPLVNDGQLRRFLSALKRKPHTAKATLIGVFFAGITKSESGQPTLRGFGHLGCCSLLVIQQVEAVER